MKKYIYLSILTCILTVFGCENDFDAKIYGSLSTTNFPQSEADYESYMMDCYIPFTLTWAYNWGSSNQHNFSVPFNQPIAYAQKVGELTNMLGAGHIMVQRYGDILDGKRTWANELARTNVRPTLKDAVAGDITAAMPYRAMVNIIEFIKMMDEVVPGFASPETLLYSPELKFYSNKVKMDTDLETNIAGLHCLGDSSGWTRGLMMASVMGVLMGRKLMEKHEF